MLQTRVKMVHVPYKGTNPVLNDILADHVDLTFIQYSAFLELYRAGKVRILAIANPTRVAALNEVPTLTELGFPELKPRMPWYGYSLGAWTPEDEAEAEVALRGDHFVTGERAKNHRVKP